MKIYLCLLVILASSLRLLAQDAAVVNARFILHDPVQPVAELYVSSVGGGMQKINFMPQAISEPIACVPTEGNLQLFSKPVVDPAEREKNLAATCKVDATMKKAIIIVTPLGNKQKLAYQIIPVSDSPTEFRKGESRIINLTPVEMAAEIGGTKFAIPVAKVTPAAAVKKVNEFNMAQANFYYREAEQWVPFSERQLHFQDTIRRIFLLYSTPGSTMPFISTIVDNAPTVIPKPPQ